MENAITSNKSNNMQITCAILSQAFLFELESSSLMSTSVVKL